jgi:DNA-binding NtrC family response regulator
MYDPGMALARKTIFLIGRDLELGMVVEDALVVDGQYRVVSTTSATTALGYIPLCTPDLLVYMLASPQQSTLHAVAAVRHQPLFANLPLVVVGGDESAMPEAWPGTTFLPYPFRADGLLRCIAALTVRSDACSWSSAAAS